jgi:hypothetical protein
MQLPLTPPLVLAALLTAGPVATHPATQPAEPGPDAQPTAVDTAASAVPSCPAYLGPRCDSPEHQGWASGQNLADLALHAHRHAA